MKIEDYKEYEITNGDISYLESICDRGKELGIVDLYENEEFKVFEKLVLNKYDHDSFIKLSFLSERLLRNYDDPKVFELGLKIIYNLIDLGEKELSTTDDLLLEYRLSDLYLLLSYIIVDDGFKTVPYDSKAKKYNIDKDNALALAYLQKAILYNPNDSVIKMSLGMYYYHKKNFYKAYDYLISAQEFLYDEFSFPSFFDIEAEAMLYNEIGIFFDSIKERKWFSGEKAYLCFKAAYLISKKCDNLTKEAFICTRYNMAYSYYRGVGVDINLEVGKKYLDELASGLLLNYGIDILNDDDPDGIIKEYYKPDFFAIALDVINLLKIDKSLIWIDKRHKKITIDNNKIVLEVKKEYINGFKRELKQIIRTSGELISFLKN